MKNREDLTVQCFFFFFFFVVRAAFYHSSVILNVIDSVQNKIATLVMIGIKIKFQ